MKEVESLRAFDRLFSLIQHSEDCQVVTVQPPLNYKYVNW